MNYKTVLIDNSKLTLIFMVVYYLILTNILGNDWPFFYCELLQIFEISGFPRLHVFLEDSSKGFQLNQNVYMTDMLY